MNKAYDEFCKLDKSEKLETILLLLNEKQISFGDISKQYVRLLEMEAEDNKEKESMFAMTLACSIDKSNPIIVRENSKKLLSKWLPDAWITKYLPVKQESIERGEKTP